MAIIHIANEGMTQDNKTTNTAALLYELQQLLIQIKTCNDINDSESQPTVGQLSTHGLQLLHYALFAIEHQQSELDLTSVSASAALFDVLHELTPLAKSYGATLQFNASSNLEPVYANETSLKGSVYALLASVITGSPHGQAPIITISVQQTKPLTQRIGVYSDTTPITVSMLNSRLNNIVRRMDSNGISHRSGLGFIVSQILAERLHTEFSSFTHNNVQGIGYYLPESAQLTLL